MTRGDRVDTESGEQVEYLHRRDDSKAARVITLRDALIVAATCTGLFGGITIFALRALIRDEISIHDNNSRAHTAITEPVKEHMARQEAEVPASRELLDRIGRIETKLNQSGESIARIEERLRK